eukprot:229119-Alexandrium_andersonii.AAC.1
MRPLRRCDGRIASAPEGCSEKLCRPRRSAGHCSPASGVPDRKRRSIPKRLRRRGHAQVQP